MYAVLHRCETPGTAICSGLEVKKKKKQEIHLTANVNGCSAVIKVQHVYASA